ncbi:MAG: hypothetical protein HC915_20760 [Anaerolineae bacterium]|nr:hypothetical protein [Anaerolineae bacterium]
MDPVRFSAGYITFRKLDADEGLTEIEMPFSSLEELCSQVLSAQEPYLVERIRLEGTDAHGQAQTIRFTFQSVTVNREEE